MSIVILGVNASAGNLPHIQAFQEEHVLLQLASGEELRATIRRPRGEHAGTHLDALLLFGGFEEAGKVLDLIHPKIPVVLASFDYPFAPPRKFEFPKSMQFAPEAKRAVHEMISGISALTNYLAKRDDVDPSRLSVVGASFGAPFVLAAAAHDERLRNIILIHGFADIPDTVEYRLKKVWTPKIGFWATPAAWILSRLGWLYLDAPSPESSIAALSPSQSVFMISADGDTIVPREAIEMLWSVLQRSAARHERMQMSGDHLQPGASELIEKLTVIVTTWLQRS